MEALLIERWLNGADAIKVIDEASVSVVRERVRAAGAAAGLDETRTASLVNVASELAHNQLAHATSGEITLRVVSRAGVAGLEVVAADSGAGIADPARALRGERTRAGSLGIGLAAVCELADEVDFDVRLGEGTCVAARKFAADGARRRCVGILGRPIDGEKRAGDDAAFVRADDALTIALMDGLGHGIEARDAAVRAVNAAMASAFDASIEEVNAATIGTRGAVGAIARIDRANAVDLRMIGNVSAYVCARHQTRRHIGSSRVFGARQGVRDARENETIALGEVLVLFSDGLSSKVSLEHEDTLLHAHPIVIAQTVLERFGTSRDDATVLVVK